MAAPTQRDPQFLHLAALAGTGGIACIGFSIGMPLWTYTHGGVWNPGFFFFGLWGIAALAGAAANVYVYFQSGPPPPKGPPRGGKPLADVLRLDARRPATRSEADRKAA